LHNMNYLLLFFVFLIINTPTESSDLTVTVSNIKHKKGSLEIALFNNGDRFMERGQSFKNISVMVKSDSETVVFRDLPKGTYAISLYHDKNSNGDCDRNFLGIPNEPYAFSNNFRPRFSRPTFKDCEFNIT